jgi:hypothetical protein
MKIINKLFFFIHFLIIKYNIFGIITIIDFVLENVLVLNECNSINIFNLKKIT